MPAVPADFSLAACLQQHAYFRSLTQEQLEQLARAARRGIGAAI